MVFLARKLSRLNKDGHEASCHRTVFGPSLPERRPGSCFVIILIGIISLSNRKRRGYRPFIATKCLHTGAFVYCGKKTQPVVGNVLPVTMP
ncbi:hypothetical protein JOM56_014794 [Amanita muscaria]